MSVITIIGITLGVLIAVCVTWLGFPGTFLIAIVSLIWGWMTGFHSITVGVILALFGVSILLEIMELVLGGLAAQYYGASKRSAVCAIVGGIFGTIIGAGVLFLIGAFVGLFAGSYLGAFLSEAVSGKSISEVGVIPDISVEEEGEEFSINTETDNQLNYALKLISG